MEEEEEEEEAVVGAGAGAEAEAEAEEEVEVEVVRQILTTEGISSRPTGRQRNARRRPPKRIGGRCTASASRKTQRSSPATVQPSQPRQGRASR